MSGSCGGRGKWLSRTRSRIPRHKLRGGMPAYNLYTQSSLRAAQRWQTGCSPPHLTCAKGGLVSGGIARLSALRIRLEHARSAGPKAVTHLAPAAGLAREGALLGCLDRRHGGQQVLLPRRWHRGRNCRQGVGSLCRLSGRRFQCCIDEAKLGCGGDSGGRGSLLVPNRAQASRCPRAAEGIRYRYLRGPASLARQRHESRTLYLPNAAAQ